MILGRRLKMSMLKKSSFLLCLIIIMIGSVWFISLKNDNSSLVGAYIDGEYASNIPSKDAGYVVEKIVCDNEAVGEWNYDEWGLLVKNMPKKSKCNVYFRKGIKLADTITLVDTSGKCPTVNSDGSVNVTSAESENSLLCSAPDNYGNSYYFRGNVQNNYVYFANFYWRIVRINGDGSVRMIYDGTAAHENGEASEDRIIGKSIYNSNGDDNAYVGYMYGTPESSTYEKTHANINNSTIKNYVDNWYESNINKNHYEKYLSDNIYCNRREVRSGAGYSKNVTYYNGYYATKLICTQSDSFSVNDNIHGNSSLKYPIGLITAEEVKISLENYDDLSKSYFYAGVSYWTMSPVYYGVDDTIYAKVTDITSTGNPYGSGGAGVNLYQAGIRPVINLKAGSLTIGDGSITNPYKIS